MLPVELPIARVPYGYCHAEEPHAQPGRAAVHRTRPRSRKAAGKEKSPRRQLLPATARGSIAGIAFFSSFEAACRVGLLPGKTLPTSSCSGAASKSLQGPGRGHLARRLHGRSPRPARRARHPVVAARLDLERMVQPGQHPRDRDPVLSRPSPPDEAREEDDARRRGRDPGRVHGHSPARGRTPCSTPISCSAIGAGNSCSARPRSATRATTGPIRRAGISSSTCGSGTRRPTRTRISPRCLRSGRPRSTWRTRYAGWPALKKLELSTS